jgi:predicted esterase
MRRMTGLSIAGIGLAVACSGSSSPTSGSGGFGSGSASAGGANNNDDSGVGGFSGAPASTAGSGIGSGSGSTSGSGSIATSGSGATSSDSDAGGTDASIGSSGSSAPSGPEGGSNPSSQFLPTSKETCPTIKTGTITVDGQSVQIWAGTPTPDQHGPVVLFWHGTGGSSEDVLGGFGQAQIDAVTNLGGVVASFSGTTMMGTDVTFVLKVWYTGDFELADEVVACSMTQLHTDPRRIYTTGESAGALMTVWLAYARSGYIAATAPLSGGLTGLDGAEVTPINMPQDPTNVPAAMVTHGAEGKDVVIIDFAQQSAAYEADIAKKGGYSMDCNTGGGHVSGPPEICPSIWEFFDDHPFKVKPEPYANGIPSGFPSYCVKGPRLADGGAP